MFSSHSLTSISQPDIKKLEILEFNQSQSKIVHQEAFQSNISQERDFFKCKTIQEISLNQFLDFTLMETIDQFNIFMNKTYFIRISEEQFQKIKKTTRLSFKIFPSEAEIIEIQKQVIQKQLQTSFYYLNSLKDKQFKWNQSEKKLLDWVIIKYSALYNKLTNNLLIYQTDQDWIEISKCVGGRTAHQCKLKWMARLIVSIYQNPWTEQEDQALLDIQNQLSLIGLKNKWEKVACKLQELKISAIFRPAKQCRERWVNKIDPQIEKCQWTQQEDLELTTFLITKGMKWAEIRRNMKKKRTEFSIRQRYYHIYQKYQKMIENSENVLEKSIIEQFSGMVNPIWTSEQKSVLQFIIQQLETTTKHSKIRNCISLNLNKNFKPLTEDVVIKKQQIALLNQTTKTIRIVDFEQLSKTISNYYNQGTTTLQNTQLSQSSISSEN